MGLEGPPPELCVEKRDTFGAFFIAFTVLAGMLLSCRNVFLTLSSFLKAFCSIKICRAAFYCSLFQRSYSKVKVVMHKDSVIQHQKASYPAQSAITRVRLALIERFINCMFMTASHIAASAFKSFHGEEDRYS